MFMKNNKKILLLSSFILPLLHSTFSLAMDTADRDKGVTAMAKKNIPIEKMAENPHEFQGGKSPQVNENITIEELDEISKKLHEYRQKKLEFKNSNFGGGLNQHVLYGFSYELGKNKLITILKFNNTNIGDYGAEKIAWALRQGSSVTELDLSLNNIGNSGISALAETIRKKSCKLQRLSLQNNEIEDGEEFFSFTKALQKNASLTYLNLKDNTIRDSGATGVGNSLFSNTTLKNINLSNNEITLNGFIGLLFGIKHTQSPVDVLDCSGNEISESLDIDTLEQGLGLLKNIKRTIKIDIMNNPAGPEWGEKFSQLGSGQKHLKTHQDVYGGKKIEEEKRAYETKKGSKNLGNELENSNINLKLLESNKIFNSTYPKTQLIDNIPCNLSLSKYSNIYLTSVDMVEKGSWQYAIFRTGHYLKKRNIPYKLCFIKNDDGTYLIRYENGLTSYLAVKNTVDNDSYRWAIFGTQEYLSSKKGVYNIRFYLIQDKKHQHHNIQCKFGEDSCLAPEARINSNISYHDKYYAIFSTKKYFTENKLPHDMLLSTEESVKNLKNRGQTIDPKKNAAYAGTSTS